MKGIRFLIAGVLVLAGCGSSGASASNGAALSTAAASAPSAPAAVTGSASAGASVTTGSSSGPSSFTSPIYGYSVAVPGGWQTRPATVRWDASGAPSSDDPSVDIVEPTAGAMSVFAFAAPISLDLAGYATDVIARNVKFHGDTCPPTPDKTEPTTIGGDPATFIAWNCGILINIAVTLHGGVGYEFVMRDPDVKAASDPADRKAFDELLQSVKFPS